MSENISQLFKDWMIATGKSKNTASNYFTGVNIVSNHYGRDLFEIDDLVEVEQLYRLYGPKGEHAEIGASNSSNVHNGLKQWLAYQRLQQTVGTSGFDLVEGRKQWEVFLARWPLEQLRALTLEHYYGAEGDDSFYSWLRDHTAKMGDFKEGILSAGVRLRGSNARAEPGVGMQSDGRHIWYTILGNSAQEAFEHLKRELLTAVDAVQNGDLSPMEGLENAPGALIWKVAFLYQDQQRPLVLPFYTQKQLKRVSKLPAGTVLQLQQQLMAQRGERDLLEYAAELDRLAQDESTSVDDTAEGDQVMGTMPIALNQILFGPPGTGKTYSTIEAALKVLDPEYFHEQQSNREALKERFNELAQQDRIRFVTFHQSFSYEDFVEGLRATTDEVSGQLRYEVVDGVFKSLCEAAAAKVTQQAEAPTEVGQRRVWKMSLGNTLGEDASIYQECLAGGYVLLGYGGAIDFSGCTNRQQVQERFAQAGVTPESPATDYGITSVAAFVSRMKTGDLIVVSDGNFKFRAIGEVTGNYQFKPHPEFDAGYSQMRSVRWLRQYSPSLPHSELLNGQFSQMTLYELRSPALNREKLEGLLGNMTSAESVALQVGQRFGQGYVVRSVGREQVEFYKPKGGVLPLPLSILSALLTYVRCGQLSVDDIRQGRVFEKVAEAEIEKHIVNGYQSLFAALVDHLTQADNQPKATAPDARVLIIDEINRGNVSRIFGELITLIEESKRAGKPEALSVVLPYSKERFSVPANLYLIGTMNTADRSLAGLDIALRRRFVFQEMPPRPELLDDIEVAGLNIGQLLRVMNQRIEVLLDRDHCLGHAYFMPLKSDGCLQRLEVIFRNQILPLLQEYFFEDWQRIAWVLNDHRKAGSDQFIQQRTSLAESLFGQEIGQGLAGSNWTLNDEAFERLEAYSGILDASLVGGEQAVKRQVVKGEITLRELASGSIEVWRAGALQQPTKPVLRELAEQLGLALESASGSLLTTRGLGRQLIDRLSQGAA